MAAEREIRAALAGIIDPCSRFNGTCLNLVEMGLVREVLIDEGAVHVRLLLTDPSCVFTFEIIREIRDAVGALHGVTEVTVESTADQLWTEERLAPETAARLEAQRAAWRQKLLPLRVRPQSGGSSPGG